uniref:Uncharacterized protein n=1 Tax=Ditylenchus dipsaci TaxID=166011 RepID=A0A915E6V7_9BILA
MKIEKKYHNWSAQIKRRLFGYDFKEVNNEVIYQEFVRSRVNLAVKLGKTSSFATSSMGIGSFLGFITWLPVFSLARVGVVNESWQRIISIMINTPTEIYSFTLGTLTANIMRNKTFSSWWASDAVKRGILKGLRAFQKILGYQVPPGLLEGIDEVKIMAPEPTDQASHSDTG